MTTDNDGVIEPAPERVQELPDSVRRHLRDNSNLETVEFLKGYRTKIFIWLTGVQPLLGYLGFQLDIENIKAVAAQYPVTALVLQLVIMVAAHYYRSKSDENE